MPRQRPSRRRTGYARQVQEEMIIIQILEDRISYSGKKQLFFLTRLYFTFVELERPQKTDVKQTVFRLKQSCLDSAITVNHAAEESHERTAIDWFFLNIQKTTTTITTTNNNKTKRNKKNTKKKTTTNKKNTNQTKQNNNYVKSSSSSCNEGLLHG